MRFISRILALPLLSTTFIWPSIASMNDQKADCKFLKTPLLSQIFSRIENYSLAESYLLSCGQLEEINLVPDDELRLTTLRKRGKDLICLTTSNDSSPCLYKVGYFTGKRNPTRMMCEMYQGLCNSSDKKIVLTETIERLYLQPSNLIR